MQTIDQELQKLIGTIFPIIGAGLLVGALISAFFTYSFIKTALRVEGRVIRLYAGGAHPEIQFTPTGEKTVKFSGSGFINYAVGDKVNVLYRKDAERPSGFETAIDTPGSLWFASMILTWIGTGFVIGGLYTKNLSKRQS